MGFDFKIKKKKLKWTHDHDRISKFIRSNTIQNMYKHFPL